MALWVSPKMRSGYASAPGAQLLMAWVIDSFMVVQSVMTTLPPRVAS